MEGLESRVPQWVDGHLLHDPLCLVAVVVLKQNEDIAQGNIYSSVHKYFKSYDVFL